MNQYIKIRIIFDFIVEKYKVSEKAIKGKTRKKEVSYARTILGALIYNINKDNKNNRGNKKNGITLEQTGVLINRDHSTIEWYLNKITEPYFKSDYEACFEELTKIINKNCKKTF